MFHKKNENYYFGEKIGYLLSFLIFTTILHFILSFTGTNNNYFFTLTITVSIIIISKLLRKVLS